MKTEHIVGLGILATLGSFLILQGQNDPRNRTALLSLSEATLMNLIKAIEEPVVPPGIAPETKIPITPSSHVIHRSWGLFHFFQGG